MENYRCITCGNDACYDCADCEEPICDKCDYGTLSDEKCLCVSCKGFLKELRNDYLMGRNDETEHQIALIKAKGNRFKGEKYQYVRAVYMELRKYNFDVTSYPNLNLTTLNSDIIDEAYRLINKKKPPAQTARRAKKTTIP